VNTSGPDYFGVLKELNVSEAVLPEYEASLEMTRQALLRLRVPPAEVQRHTDNVRQELYAALYNQGDDYQVLSQLRGAEQQFDLQWIRLDPNSPIVHKSIGDSGIRKKTGASVVGVVREGQLKPNPDADFILRPGDLAAIIGNDHHRKAFCVLASSGPRDCDGAAPGNQQ
jgi:monovalent cation:H+ antiporter-2, CPA2 family